MVNLFWNKKVRYRSGPNNLAVSLDGNRLLFKKYNSGPDNNKVPLSKCFSRGSFLLYHQIMLGSIALPGLHEELAHEGPAPASLARAQGPHTFSGFPRVERRSSTKGICWSTYSVTHQGSIEYHQVHPVSSTSSKVILNLKDVSKRNINLHEMLEATKENLQQKRGIQ